MGGTLGAQTTKAKISVWDDLSTVYMAAQVLGYDKPDPSQLYNLIGRTARSRKKEIDRAETQHSKDMVHGRGVDQSLSKSRNRSRHGLAAHDQQLRKLNSQSERLIPKENTTGWIDHLDDHRRQPATKNLAAQFLEYMIEAQTQKKVTDRNGLLPANPQVH